ncbi:MAG: glycosyltransferase family 9 protein [Luteolibacter sp.]
MSEKPPFSPFKSLLVIKPSSLGDIVHGLQILQSVKRQLPECRVTWVVRDRFAGLVEAAPFVDEVIRFRRKEGFRGIWEILETLRRRRFDVVWDLQGLLRSGLMAAAAKAPVKRGRRDSREGAGLFTKPVAEPVGEGPYHAIRVLQEFPKAHGLDPEVTFPLELKPGPRFAWSSFFNGDPNAQFVIFTDSRGVGKEWPKFDALTHLIWKNIPGSRVAWCAGQPTSPGGEIPEGRFLNLTGCPLDEMIELCRQPSVFIGNDSGPMHLSAAVGNKVLAIFGPTSPLRFGPWPIGSPRTRSVQAPGGVLMDLTPEAVFDEVKKLGELR